MAEEIEPNGDEETGEERFNRIERVLKLMPEYHLQFREEHNLLLSSEVQVQGGLETLRGQVATLVTEFREFGRHVETIRKDFDQRLKRLET
jgi:hypothetical protein